MNATAPIVADESASTALAPLVEANPVMVLVEPEKFERFYAEIAGEVAAHVPDLETAGGRKAIASLAYKVARTKTAIDEAGKQLTEDKRAEIKVVDDSRKKIRDRLDALRDEARKPLTDWEAAEEKRATDARSALDDIKAHAHVSLIDTVDSVERRLEKVRGWELTEALFRESLPLAKATLANASEALEAAHARLLREEADRVELDRLRQEKAEREAKEAAERAEREAKEKAEADAKAAAERAEQNRLAEEKRVADATKAAEDRVRREAEQKAQAEADAKDKAHREELATANRAREALEAKARQEEAARQAEAVETAKREANRQHRGRVLANAKAAVMKHGVEEEKARAVILAIAAGQIPNVTLSY